MLITHKRLVQLPKENPKGTLGAIYIDGEFYGTTMEDIHRDIKVDGETRIPSGSYELGYRQILSGMTKKYRSKYDWFKWHLWIKEVPGFNFCYLHIGNKPEHSEGCVLIATSADFVNPFIGSSAAQFEKFYARVSEALDNGERVTIVIEDEPSC